MGLSNTVNAVLKIAGLRVIRLKHLPPTSHQMQAKILERLGVKEVRTIFDAGANVGQTNRKYRSVFPKANIHSFEPFDGAFAKLQEATQGDPRSRAFQMAIGEAPGTQTFNISQNSQMNSFLQVGDDGRMHMGGKQATVVEQKQVPVTSIDSFCQDQNIDTIDILKMDIQGGETAAIRGASRMLANKAIKLIYTEVLFADLYKGAAWFDDLWQQMRERGYVLHGLHNLANGYNGFLGHGDAIFVPRIPELHSDNQIPVADR